MGRGFGPVPSLFLEAKMKVNVTRGFYGAEGNVAKGMTLNVSDGRGAELLRRGLATEVQAKKAEAPDAFSASKSDVQAGPSSGDGKRSGKPASRQNKAES